MTSADVLGSVPAGPMGTHHAAARLVIADDSQILVGPRYPPLKRNQLLRVSHDHERRLRVGHDHERRLRMDHDHERLGGLG